MIEAILQRLNAIPADKVAHFASGVILFALSFHLVGAFIAFGIVALAAFGKEIYDWFNKDTHTPDAYDALATMLGGLVAFTIAL